MAPKFGTSGLRGLVTDLTADLVYQYTASFLRNCDTGGAIHIGWDLRPSSPDIALAVLGAGQARGQHVTVAGALPTPALAQAAAEAGAGAIMITGSHIPADRNGLKFYTTAGEISKTDEVAILAGLDRTESAAPAISLPVPDATAITGYVARYVSAFGAGGLAGMTIGVYQHSSVARDVMVTVIEALGACAVPLGRTDSFTPVDTEAVDDATRTQFRGWCADNELDALISTDGDADRPMVADHKGQVVPGDVLGALTARALGAAVVCTPVSSNTMIAQMPDFERVALTRIGSPYVIAAMEEVLATDAAARVVGYEANGGFLLGYEAQGPAGPLAPLMTRDCLLPVLASLHAARASGTTLADVVAALPPRFTAANRLTEVPTESSAALIADLRENAGARDDFFDTGSSVAGVDLTDGLRVSFVNGDVVHLRPSGNAPELRCYAEADTADRAWTLVNTHLARLRTLI